MMMKQCIYVFCRLLDSSSGFDCDAFKRVYANVLFQFGLHKQRVQLMKYIESATPQPHVGLGLFPVAAHLPNTVLYRKGLEGWRCVSQSHGASPAMWDHTVFVTRHPTQVNAPHLNSSQVGWYSIYLPWRDGRLSWPGWLAIYWDGLPVYQQSPVQVVTGPGVDRD